jgi:hypothetical protein
MPRCRRRRQLMAVMATGYSTMMNEWNEHKDDGLEDGDGLYYHQRWIAVLAASEAWGGV